MTVTGFGIIAIAALAIVGSQAGVSEQEAQAEPSGPRACPLAGVIERDCFRGTFWAPGCSGARRPELQLAARVWTPAGAGFVPVELTRVQRPAPGSSWTR